MTNLGFFACFVEISKVFTEIGLAIRIQTIYNKPNKWVHTKPVTFLSKLYISSIFNKMSL